MTGRQHLDPAINVFIRHIDYNLLTSKKTADIRMASRVNSCVKDLMFIYVHISAAHLFGVACLVFVEGVCPSFYTVLSISK